MTRYRPLLLISLFALLLGSLASTAPAEESKAIAPAPRLAIDLTGYHTTSQAIRANPKEFMSGAILSTAGYVGVVVGDKEGKAIVEAVEPESPADLAGFHSGDIVRTIAGREVHSGASAREALRSHLAGKTITIGLEREGKQINFLVTPRATSKPMTGTGGRAILGIQLATGKMGSGVKLTEVTSNGPADKAGLKVGDVITRIDGNAVESDAAFRDILAEKRPGDRLDLLAERDGMRVEAKAVLAAEDAPRPAGGKGGGGGWDDRLPNAWRKPAYRLAIIGVEYPDQKHNAKVADKDWEDSMFSTGAYTGKSATGQTVHGSMCDYYKELSCGAFHPEGKFVGWVEVGKKRMEYATGSGTSPREKSALLTEAMDKLVARDKDALKDYDGVFFLYAGERVNTNRGSLYWPHRASITHAGKRWPYFIVQEGGAKMNDISVFCHEFGHMLGLPDLYAAPERPGSEGVGRWCAMSEQVGGGKPQHFCAWSKEQLGWVKPVMIDPRIKQKLILSPIENTTTECFKIMIRADGSEYFLLENRQKRGWDESLPAEGLLIWRVVNNRPVLEESHGVEGASGPKVFLDSVPFPSASNTAFTPYTTPSSKSQLGGGIPVYVSNIRRLPDGRITFHIGYEYQ